MQAHALMLMRETRRVLAETAVKARSGGIAAQTCASMLVDGKSRVVRSMT
jgi:hypothetical protein